MDSQENKTKKSRGNPHISELGRATRFRPGHSGNPGGRPAHTPFTDAIRDVSQLMVSELQIFPTDSVPIGIAKRLAKDALNGKISAASEVANRVEGLPRQRSEVLGECSREVVLRVVHGKKKRDKRKAKQAADALSLSDGDGDPI